MNEANLYSSGAEPGTTLFSAAQEQRQILGRMVKEWKKETKRSTVASVNLYRIQQPKCQIEEDLQ